jgi:hypothetical protein
MDRAQSSCAELRVEFCNGDHEALGELMARGIGCFVGAGWGPYCGPSDSALVSLLRRDGCSSAVGETVCLALHAEAEGCRLAPEVFSDPDDTFCADMHAVLSGDCSCYSDLGDLFNRRIAESD